MCLSVTTERRAEGVAATVGQAVAATFATLSALRHRRVFHPYGAAFAGTLTVRQPETGPLGVALLDDPAEHECIVRFSRGAGLPEPLPDILGMAVRITERSAARRTQDLLLVTAGEQTVLRHVFRPSASYTSHHYSSLVPYRVAGVIRLFGARSLAAPGARTCAALASLVARGGAELDLETATIAGPWRAFGTVHLHHEVEPSVAERLRFDVANSDPGIDAVGVLNALRRQTYPASQRARLDPERQPV